MNRRTALQAFIGAVITVLGASACGQKGPLFSAGEKLEELERKRDQEVQERAARKKAP